MIGKTGSVMGDIVDMGVVVNDGGKIIGNLSVERLELRGKVRAQSSGHAFAETRVSLTEALLSACPRPRCTATSRASRSRSTPPP